MQNLYPHLFATIFLNVMAKGEHFFRIAKAFFKIRISGEATNINILKKHL